MLWADERFKAWNDLPPLHVEMAASEPEPTPAALNSSPEAVGRTSTRAT
jgi:hypothetical protein